MLEISVEDSQLTGRPEVGLLEVALSRIPKDGRMTAWLPLQVCCPCSTCLAESATQAHTGWHVWVWCRLRLRCWPLSSSAQPAARSWRTGLGCQPGGMGHRARQALRPPLWSADER